MLSSRIRLSVTGDRISLCGYRIARSAHGLPEGHLLRIFRWTWHKPLQMYAWQTHAWQYENICFITYNIYICQRYSIIKRIILVYVHILTYFFSKTRLVRLMHRCHGNPKVLFVIPFDLVDIEVRHASGWHVLFSRSHLTDIYTGDQPCQFCFKLSDCFV